MNPPKMNSQLTDIIARAIGTAKSVANSANSIAAKAMMAPSRWLYVRLMKRARVSTVLRAEKTSCPYPLCI